MPTICTLTLIFSLFLSIVCFSGCEKLDENLDTRLKESYDAINSGRYSRALVILDELSSSHSNHSTGWNAMNINNCNGISTL